MQLATRSSRREAARRGTGRAPRARRRRRRTASGPMPASGCPPCVARGRCRAGRCRRPRDSAAPRWRPFGPSASLRTGFAQGRPALRRRGRSAIGSDDTTRRRGRTHVSSASPMAFSFRPAAGRAAGAWWAPGGSPAAWAARREGRSGARCARSRASRCARSPGPGCAGARQGSRWPQRWAEAPAGPFGLRQPQAQGRHARRSSVEGRARDRKRRVRDRGSRERTDQESAPRGAAEDKRGSRAGPSAPSRPCLP